MTGWTKSSRPGRIKRIKLLSKNHRVNSMGKEESSGPSNKCAERRIVLQMVLQNETTLECTATFSKFSAQLQNLNCLKQAFS